MKALIKCELIKCVKLTFTKNIVRLVVSFSNNEGFYTFEEDISKLAYSEHFKNKYETAYNSVNYALNKGEKFVEIEL